MEEFLETIQDYLLKIYDFFTPGGGLSSIIDFILEKLSGLVSYILNFLYDFIFVGLYDKSMSYGNLILGFLYGKFSSQTVSFNFIAYLVGFIFVLFVLKRVWSLLR